MGKFIWILKALVILSLAVAIFGSAGWFAYQLFVKPYQVPIEEAGSHAPPPLPPDPSLPEFDKAMALKQARKLVEARTALEAFLDNNPFSSKVKEARAALGQVNTDLFFSAIPDPQKIRYVIKPGDALIRIERKLKTNEELIMRANNLDDPTRLRVGQVLMVNQPDFSLVIDRKQQTVLVLNHSKFFKEYHAASWSVPPVKKGQEKAPIAAKVGAKIAWHNGARVAFGTKDYAGSERWVEITSRGYTLYTEGGKKPTVGIGIAPDDMEELSTLLSKNVPVSIQ